MADRNAGNAQGDGLRVHQPFRPAHERALYRKNDQAWVEQKNGAVVRKMVGYRRYEDHDAATMFGERLCCKTDAGGFLQGIERDRWA